MNATILARCEYKYKVTAETVERLRTAIKPYCQLDEHGASHADGYYPINSLYFDDDRYRLYRDTVNGESERFKVRVRNYGQASGGVVKLEVKRRINDVVIKTSAWLPQDGWTEWITPGGRRDPSTLSEANREALNNFLTTMRRAAARPKMLVRYERQAYRSLIDDYVRITFDRHMIHQPMTRYDLNGSSSRWSAMDDAESMGGSGSRFLLELKFARSVPVWLVDIVRRLGLVRQGYSKYGCAVRRSFMARDTGWDLVQAPVFGGSRLEAVWSY